MTCRGLATFCLLLCAARGAADVELDLGVARLTLTPLGYVASLRLADGSHWPASGQPAFWIETERATLHPQSVRLSGDALGVEFAEGFTAEFRVSRHPGFAVFELVKLAPQEGIRRLRLFSLPAPRESTVLGVLNAAQSGEFAAGVLAAEPNVQAVVEHFGSHRADRRGCSHQFVQSPQAKVGRGAARFTASSDSQPGGWAMRGKALPGPLDLSGCKAIRAWVHGDGKGQALKIQLHDNQGGYRDNYLTIDFEGWKQVTLTDSPINTLRYDRVAALNFYYNSLPPNQTVTCLIDQVEAVLQRDGAERVVLLEDFESPASMLWSGPLTTLNVQTHAKHGLVPARFGLLAAPRSQWFDTVRRFELAAGLPSPQLGGAWNKTSPWVKRSYFFLTNFSESQFDEALAIARRGGFHMILLGQESWCRGTGHYEIHRARFPDGLEGLKRTIGRFKEAGFHVGLHFLAASIYPPDPYLTPVPDSRLVKGACATLDADVDEKAVLLPTAAAPADFPAEDGGYEGSGTVLQIGDELVWYGARRMEPPFGFAECKRGYLGTRAAAHRKGDRVVHLLRAYGYHMYDMDTSLLEEVAGHFAKVANACQIEMIYFDGSERLQGEHWYYNPRLHKAFYDKLDDKNILLQASSFSHYSWHLLARSASADGHGDLKGYLDERSPGFDWLAREGMPLDIGWYYGYDPGATPDMYEYILGATIGYDASMSFQVSPDAAARHPFTGEILDLIARYEKLRLSGRVGPEIKALLRIDSALGGKKTPEERQKLAHHRREYRLLGPEGKEVFQRVIYAPWREVKALDGKDNVWTVEVKERPARIGVQIHAQAGPWLHPGPAYHAADAVVLETFDDLAPYTRDPKNRRNVRAIGPGESGAVLPGVTQRFELSDQAGPAQGTYAVYSAENALAAAGGWSVMGRTFDPPIDLSRHAGIGFWLRGDGKGGSFKLQLRDGAGATDYYVANDFTGWRYEQLARPANDPIDYKNVRALSFYYNGLPAKTAVSCAIDDVKAISRLDRRAVVDPFVEVGGQRLTWTGSMEEGQYLMVWPGEPVSRHGLPLKQADRSATPAPDVSLPPGSHAVKFGCAGALIMPVRVRVTLQVPERHEVQ